MTHTIELGTGEQFAALRQLLATENYTEETLCLRFGIEKLSDFEDVQDRDQVEPWDKDGTGVLLRFLVETRFVPEAVAAEKLGAANLELLTTLGLVKRSDQNASDLWSPVSLVPFAGVWSVCDSWHSPDRAPYSPKDPVYTPIVSNAHRFFSYLPRTKCERFLELCSGTAFAAMHAAKNFAQEAYAFDISPRSTHFGEFNRRLNAVENAFVRQGDLYAPAGQIQFDRIVAHPPYVPVLRPKWVFHDGGVDGEAIVKRVIEEAPQYLAPGGQLYMLAMGTDREKPYEKRIREWLGSAENEFDIAVFPIRLITPDDFATRATAGSRTAREDQYRFKDLFRELEVDNLVYSVQMLQRRAVQRKVFTVRRQFGDRTGRSEMEWMIEWETLAVSAEAAEKILNARPKPNSESKLVVHHELADGEGWQVDHHKLLTPYPFSMEAKTDPWAPFLMALCDGERTARELLVDLKQQGAIPSDATEEEFARAISVLVSGGFLFLDNI
jgi:SAM-dependent methyltransferase